MIGLRTGLRVGPNVGLAVGISADELGGGVSMAGVTKDATSGIYVPANSTEWATTAAVAGISAPSNLWLLQEASGNFADSIGSATLTASGFNYRQAVTNWTRTAAMVGQGGAGIASSSSIGDLSSSGLLLAYVKLAAAVTATRTIMGMGSGSNHRYAVVTTTPCYGGKDNNGGAEVDGTQNVGTSVVRPLIVQVDRNASAFRVISDQEIITPVYQAPAAGALLNLGAAIGTTAACDYLYAAYFTGTAAQLTTAQIRTLLTTLNWSPAW